MGRATIDGLQRKAARIVGAAYLLALATSLFAEVYVRGSLIVQSDGAQSARNILAHEGLFRLGTVANLTTFAADVALLTALFVTLRPVAPSLALAAAFFRLVETATISVSALNDFDVLRLLSGASYLQPLEAYHLHALARSSIGAHGAAYQVGLFFFSFGSTLFCYLWLKSRYIPKGLAGLGVLASALVGVCAYLFILFPELVGFATPACYAPIFVFELIIGLWLLLKGLRAPGPSSARVQTDAGTVM